MELSGYLTPLIYLEFFRFQQHINQVAKNQERKDKEKNHGEWGLNFFEEVNRFENEREKGASEQEQSEGHHAGVV